MSTQPDWSKAPEGATHYLSPFFYREEQNGKVFYMAERAWVTSHYAAGQLEAKGAQRIDKKPAWTGIGLPPVGTVCEVDGEKVFVVAHHMNGINAIYAEAPDSGLLYYGEPNEFRPIRTPEQIAAEEREKAIEQLISDYQYAVGPCNYTLGRDQAKRIHDIGYCKPGLAEQRLRRLAEIDTILQSEDIHIESVRSLSKEKQEILNHYREPQP